MGAPTNPAATAAPTRHAAAPLRTETAPLSVILVTSVGLETVIKGVPFGLVGHCVTTRPALPGMTPQPHSSPPHPGMTQALNGSHGFT
jgi:hypothetical protein